MPIASDLLATIEETVNRLAAESVLATAGRDEGLVPGFSLLGELRELCLTEAALREPTAAMHARLEHLLDRALPFDEVSLGALREFVQWLPGALAAVQAGRPVPPGASSASPDVAAPPAADGAPPGAAAETGGVGADGLLELHLGDNRELLAEFFAEAVDHLQQIEAALLVLDQEPGNPEALSGIFRSFHTIKGNAGFLGLVPMHTLAHEVESLLDLARNHRLRLDAAIVTEILRSRDALSALTQQIGAALESGRLPDRVVPVRQLIQAVRLLARPSAAEPVPRAASASEPAALPARTAAAASPAVGAPVVASPVEANPESRSAPPAKGAGANQTVRVSTEKLDSLMDVVGELVIVQSQLVETARERGDAGSNLQRNVGQLTRIAKELQHTAMALRMIPVKPTFQKMERLARDLARDFGKKVAFSTSGEDTELDRTVVEEIADPLVHMVRNALDHGLESVEGRIAAGKPETGQLQLRAGHEGGHIVLELVDDGRGIDPDRVLAKARRQGLVPEGAQLSREEIFGLLFLPGFSTAEKVTSVSGRGVGMDVVKRNIEKLRGRIEIESAVGRGSTFRIRLPLTLAIIDGLVVRVGADRFILPSTSVQMALRPAREHISAVQGRGELLDLRGRLLPLHRLHRRFGIAAQAEKPWEGIVVIVEHSGKVSALLVDELVSKQEVVIKSLGAFIQNLPGVAGGAILGDGNIALILDPATLLRAA